MESRLLCQCGSYITLQCMALHRLHGIMGDTPYRIVTISVRIKPKQRPPRQNAYLDNIYAWQGLPPIKSTEILDEPDGGH